MTSTDDIVWQDDRQRIVLAPRAGGRVVSWEYAGRERVHPLLIGEGGLLRFMLAEEQYPGSNYATPHQVVSAAKTDDGFRVHLRHRFNAANWFVRRMGWPEKANELHVDDLVLDKIITFRARESCLLVDLTVTNVSGERKYVTPWVHNAMTDWPADRWMVVDGERRGYEDKEIYWGSHLAERGRSMRVVHAEASGELFSVFGAPTEHLRGFAAMLPVPGEFLQSTAELRGEMLELDAGRRWRGNYFLALTDDWRRWSRESPVELVSVIEDAPAARRDDDDERSYAVLLDDWMLEDERRRGVMVLSFLDKPPFFAGTRFDAANCFAGFHPTDGGGAAEAHVVVYASRDVGKVTAALTGGGDGWALGFDARGREVSQTLAAHDTVKLFLRGPSDLRGAVEVRVDVRVGGAEPITLTVAPGATVEPRYPYQVRQTPTYVERRYSRKTGPDEGASADEIRQWQVEVRAKTRQYLDFLAEAPCPPEPRLVERQNGPTCVREKWLVQAEPGIWVPGYLIRPHAMTGRRPLVYYLHGSGPGKDGFAYDEDESIPRSQLGHELEFMPYRLATMLNCQLYVPDGRGQGEMGETNPAQWTQRNDAMGLNNAMLRVLDLTRSLDWILTRPEVDPRWVGSYGCSGGGGMTYWFAGVDERVAASIVSSTSAAMPLDPLLDGYFRREFVGRDVRIDPLGLTPVSGAPLGMLVAPRPMWIVDGLDDLGVPEHERVAWRQRMQRGRDQIRSVYRRLGAEDRFEDTWFAGGHCGGMTVDNVARWFARWFGPS